MTSNHAKNIFKSLTYEILKTFEKYFLLEKRSSVYNWFPL